MLDYGNGNNEARVAWELSPDPGWLESDVGQLFCWYHPPRVSSRNIAVLLCDPLGSDRMNLHLTYRHIALSLSHLGFPVLRIDYPGTCDSSGSPREPSRLSAYDGALRCGADYLKTRSGLSKLAVFGVRFGGTMAIRFASRNQDVSHVAVWGAYRSGREFLRNESAIERMSGANPEQSRPTGWQDGDMESLGFLYSADTSDELRSIDFSKPVDNLCDHAVVFSWDSFAKDRQIAQCLEGSGATVDLHETPLDPAEASIKQQRVPEALVAELSRWLLDHSSESEKSAKRDSASDTTQTASLAPSRVLLQSNHTELVEESVRLGPERDLFGILTEPVAPTSRRPSILLVNGGNNHRAGINRNYVEWARLWASLGYSVLRIDIRGLGDSPARQAEQLNQLYRNETLEDLRHSIDWLSDRSDDSRIILCGLCAGAYQALHSIRTDHRIEAAVLIELLRFYENEPSYRSPKRGLGGRLFRRIVRYRRLLLPGGGKLAQWLKNISESRRSLLVIYREDEHMLDTFRKEAGSSISLFNESETLKLHLMDSSNHIFSPLWSQQQLTSVITEYIETFSVRVDPEHHG